MKEPPPLKPVVWMADSLRVLRTFPKAVQQEMGYAVYLAQTGSKHLNAKPMKSFGPGVLEVISDHHGDTYRAIYTLRLAGKIYVLHAFQKKSKRGIATPRSELALIQQRLKRATELHTSQEN